MIGDYANILRDLTTIGERNGFKIAVDEDFYCELVDLSGKQIILSGDKSTYPSFSLLVSPSTKGENRHIYAIWMLMKVFKNRVPSDRTIPNVKNQLWFLETYLTDVFNDEPLYRKDYERLNFEGG